MCVVCVCVCWLHVCVAGSANSTASTKSRSAAAEAGISYILWPAHMRTQHLHTVTHTHTRSHTYACPEAPMHTRTHTHTLAALECTRSGSPGLALTKQLEQLHFPRFDTIFMPKNLTQFVQ